MSDSTWDDLVVVVHDIVLPVLRQMTKPGELDELALHWQPSDDARDKNERDLWMKISLRGEPFSLVLWSTSYPAIPDSVTRSRVASELQDFIAESGFGWGEQRTYEE